MKGNVRYHRIHEVPEGYFDGLEKRLMSIPNESQKKKKIWAFMPEKNNIRRLTPYIGLVAGFALIAGIGTILLRMTTSPLLNEYEEMQYADIIPLGYPYLPTEEEYTSSEASSEDDIETYLIDNNISIEQIEYYENEK